MATMLRESDSTDKSLNAGKRHVRLSRQVGATALVDAIQPWIDTLLQKQQATRAAAEAREGAYDDVVLVDGYQDNTVKNAFDGAKGFDRDNPGAGALSRTFPDGRFTSITRMNTSKEPDAVERLAQRFESFDASHPLFAHAALLRQKAEICRAKIDVYKAAVKAEKAAEADEQIVKFELKQQYEQNYLDARKQFGKSLSERLFPALGSHRSGGPDEEEPPAPEQE